MQTAGPKKKQTTKEKLIGDIYGMGWDTREHVWSHICLLRLRVL